MQSRKVAFLVDRDTVVGVLVKADHHRLGGGIAGVDRPILRGVDGSTGTVPQGSAADLNKTDELSSVKFSDTILLAHLAIAAETVLLNALVAVSTTIFPHGVLNLSLAA